MEMAKKKKARRPQPRQQSVQTKESNFWKITAIIAIILLAGVTAKTMFPGGQSTTTITPIQATSAQPIPIQPITGQSPAVQKATSTATNSIEDQCQCDMPKGAVEEKRFIRTKLTEGYTVPQVIELVDKKYGFRV
jgi:hypothetical protein